MHTKGSGWQADLIGAYGNRSRLQTIGTFHLFLNPDLKLSYNRLFHSHTADVVLTQG